MNIADIIALAKQGYKPNDIKELLAIAEVSEQKTEAPEVPAVEPEQTAEDQEKPVDYKILYEQQQAEIEKLKADNKKVSDDLIQAQKDNINQDISGLNTIETPIDIWTKFCKER